MAKTPSTAIRCPRCINTTMIEQTCGGVRVHICMQRGENFFRAGGLTLPPGAVRVPSRVLCPVPECRGATMDHVRFDLDPPLEIEVCPTCGGVLLDFEEIRRIPVIASWAKKPGHEPGAR